MNLDQYKNICDRLNFIISRSSPSDIIRDIPQLYLVRNTPEYSKVLEDLSDKEISFIRILRSLVNRPKIYLSGLARVFQSAVTLKCNKNFFLKKHDIIFISHIFTNNQKHKDDVYFNGLYRSLDSRQIKYSVLYFNSSGSRYLSSPGVRTDDIVLDKIGSLCTESKILFSQLRKSASFLSRAFSRKKISLFERNVLFQSSILSLSGWAFELEYRKRVFSSIFISNPPRKLILSHEGLGWERQVTKLFHELNPSGSVIAYQHVPIFATSNSMACAYKYGADPDLILFSSNFYLNVFKKYNNNGLMAKLLSLGNVRYYDSEDVKLSANDEHLKTFLLPQGSLEESVNYIKLAEQLASSIVDEIYLSLHPLVHECQKVQYEISRVMKCSTKIKLLSGGEWRKMISSKSYVISSGSSAYIPFCRSGALPILYRYNKSNTDLSPMLVINSDIPVGNCYDDVISIINNYSSYFDEQHQNEFFQSCADIYDPFNEELLFDSLDLVTPSLMHSE